MELSRHPALVLDASSAYIAWGTGTVFETCKKRHPFEVLYFIDNDRVKQNTQLHGKPVRSPEEAKVGTPIIIFTLSFEEIKQQLETKGLVYGKNFFHFLDVQEFKGLIDETVDSGEYRALEKYIQPGFYCVDIGACIGLFTYKLAMLTGPKGKVYSFEPIPVAFQDVLRIKERYQFSQVEAIQIALSDAAGKAKMLVPNSNGRRFDALAHFVIGEDVVGASQADLDEFSIPSFSVGTGTEHEVETRTLDSFNLQRVDYIKIDVEGAELLVLRGAVETIRRCRPIIQCEIFFERYDKDTRQKILQFFKDEGYQQIDEQRHDFFFAPRQDVS